MADSTMDVEESPETTHNTAAPDTSSLATIKNRNARKKAKKKLNQKNNEDHTSAAVKKEVPPPPSDSDVCSLFFKFLLFTLITLLISVLSFSVQKIEVEYVSARLDDVPIEPAFSDIYSIIEQICICRRTLCSKGSILFFFLSFPFAPELIFVLIRLLLSLHSFSLHSHSFFV